MQCRYAKWRAAHLHNCLNSGETPSEPAPKPEEGVLNDADNLEFGLPSSSSSGQPSNYQVHLTSTIEFKQRNNSRRFFSSDRHRIIMHDCKMLPLRCRRQPTTSHLLCQQPHHLFPRTIKGAPALVIPSRRNRWPKHRSFASTPSAPLPMRTSLQPSTIYKRRYACSKPASRNLHTLLYLNNH